MASFLLVGEGAVAAQVARAIAATPGALLAGHACARPAEGGIAASTLATAEGLALVRALAPDWLLSVNSTLVLPAALLDLFDGRALNAHPGPLPEYGGLHAHQWAIRHGARDFGATLHAMEARLDAGPIVGAARFPITPDDTGLTLFRRAMEAAARLATEAVARIAAKEALPRRPQDPARRRVFRHRDALDGRMDWTLPARAVADFVRAGNYEPFRSPTYVAAMTTPGGTAEVLRTDPAGPTAAAPGSVVALDAAGPVIACGDGMALRITRARQAGALLDEAGWRRLLR